MNKVKLNELIKNDNIIIPVYIFKLFNKFNLTMEEFVILMYLYDKDKKIFDPEIDSSYINYDLKKYMNVISDLTNKGLLKIESSTNDNVFFDYYDLSNFYDKISMFLIEELNTKEEHSSELYLDFEKTLERKLKDVEKDEILSWQTKYPDELIKGALKESVLNNVDAFRYIGQILYDWQKEGIKSLEDLENNRRNLELAEKNFYNSNSDYNWLEDEEEI